jgi:hypothetical protein
LAKSTTTKGNRFLSATKRMNMTKNKKQVETRASCN